MGNNEELFVAAVTKVAEPPASLSGGGEAGEGEMRGRRWWRLGEPPCRRAGAHSAFFPLQTKCSENLDAN
jgi:hypothetical protein